MRYALISYSGETPVDYSIVELTDYDGDPYGDSVPFVVHSNQRFVAEDDLDYEIVQRIDNRKALNCDVGTPEGTTAALSILAAATEALGNEPYCCGCKAFWGVPEFKRFGHELETPINDDILCIVMCDGGDLAHLLNRAYEHHGLMNAFYTMRTQRGYQIQRLAHFAYGVYKLEKN